MASRRMPDAEQKARSAPIKKSVKRAPVKRKPAAGTQSVLAATAVPVVSADERRAMIARAAYLRGESRGFPPGGEAEDWLAAEKEVDGLLSGGYRADQ
ncbi:MAG: DUF2934 domain-containing protein [Steroidobacteraceae bacterium]